MIIVDIETAGTDPLKSSILSIGALDFHSPSNHFYGECRIDDDTEVLPASLEICGFTEEQIRDPAKPTVAQLLKDFFKWFGQFEDRTIAGQNVTFDRDFINAAAEKHGLPERIGRRVVDMHSVCVARYLAEGRAIPLEDGFSHLNTDTILKYVGLEERPGTHNGLEDARLEAEAFSRLIFGKNLLPHYAQFPVPPYLLRHEN